MSVDPDPAELTAPRDPADYGRTRLMGPGYWAMIGFAVLCVAAGAGVATFGAKLFPAKPAAPRPAAIRSLDDPLTASRALPAAVAATPTAPPTANPDNVDVAALSARLKTVEAQQARTAESAAAALSAAALLEAAQTSRPFAEELTALQAVSPPSAELRALRSLAATGAPSRAALAVEFPDYAAKAAGAAHIPGDHADLWTQVRSAIARVIVIRRVGDLPGGGVDAVLARAERELGDGEVERALKTLDGLPPAGRDAMEPWLVRARTRAEIDRRVSTVRAQALEELARQSRSGA